VHCFYVPVVVARAARRVIPRRISHAFGAPKLSWKLVCVAGGLTMASLPQSPLTPEAPRPPPAAYVPPVAPAYPLIPPAYWWGSAPVSAPAFVGAAPAPAPAPEPSSLALLAPLALVLFLVRRPGDCLDG
jgi:hypothetical protein